MPNLIPSGLDSLRDNIMDVFDRWLPARREEARPGTMPQVFFAGPVVDVVEDDTTVRVTAELPGLSEKDFMVEVVGDRLILRGEKKADHEEHRDSYYCCERSYGSFARSIPLPCAVMADKAKATYRRGMLEIELPKEEGAKGTRVKVDVE